nr:AAA domain [uncultured organism]
MIVDGFRVDGARFDEDARSAEWPWTVPAVAQLARDGMRFRAPITVLVGENGAGKSTLVEAMAEAYGVDVRGGHGARRYASALPKGSLGEHLRFDRGSLYGMARGAGYFLRAETAMGVLEYMTGAGVDGYGDESAAEISHGEGFLQLFRGRFDGPGLYLLDEPESALSFTSSLALVSTLLTVASERGQVICATHSPIIAATPGADIIQVDSDGFHRTSWDDLEMVGHWQRFLRSPEQYLRHLR